jgi:hypothetical protein
MRDSIKIIKKYFKLTKIDKGNLFMLFITSFVYKAPYMFTPLVWTLIIKYLLLKNLNTVNIDVKVLIDF